jgi:hypothetical protein
MSGISSIIADTSSKILDAGKKINTIHLLNLLVDVRHLKQGGGNPAPKHETIALA